MGGKTLEGEDPKEVTRCECASGTSERRGLLQGVEDPGAAAHFTVRVLSTRVRSERKRQVGSLKWEHFGTLQW